MEPDNPKGPLHNIQNSIKGTFDVFAHLKLLTDVLNSLPILSRDHIKSPKLILDIRFGLIMYMGTARMFSSIVPPGVGFQL
jgi:hypothetical protein